MLCKIAPRDLGLLLIALAPAPIGRPVQDLGHMVVCLRLRDPHVTSAAVDVGLPLLFFISLEKEWMRVRAVA